MPSPRSLTELLVAMVGFDTVNATLSGRAEPELALAVYLESLAQNFGLATRRLPVSGHGFNLLVTHEANSRLPWLMFLSHMDTVGVEGMTVPPFEGRIVDGHVLGRGACDTKASGAAMLWAMQDYARVQPTGAEAGNNIALAFTVDEEIGKAGIRALVRDLPAIGHRFAGAVVGEPTMLKPVVAHCGCVRWTIRTTGAAAHSSDPSKGRSAISMMVKVIDAIETRYAPALSAAHPLTGRAVCSVNQVHGGTSVNVIPESCDIRLDRRIVPGEDMHDVLPGVERVLDALRRENPSLNVRQEEPFLDPALDPAGAAAFIAHLGRTLRTLGLPDQPLGVPFSTEASNLSHAGIPTVVLGPGDIAAAHTRNESVEVSQVERAADVYLALMRSRVGS
jgi:acetylornithine deacetylase